MRRRSARRRRFVGFVFYPPSPRNLDRRRGGRAGRDRAAGRSPRSGCSSIRTTMCSTDVLEHVPLDLLQFHGAETPGARARCKRRFGMPVMKAIPVAAPGRSDAGEALFRRRRPAAVRRQAAQGRRRCPAATASPSTGSCCAAGAGRCRGCCRAGLTPDNLAEAAPISARRMRRRLVGRRKRAGDQGHREDRRLPGAGARAVRLRTKASRPKLALC